MIEKFVERFDASRDKLRERFAAGHPSGYEGIVKAVVECLKTDDEYDGPDPERIVKIDHGDYQGTLLFVIGAAGYQPSTYWAVPVGYGSCSGCDTFESIRDYDDDPPSEKQVDEYMTLALHVVQKLRQIAGYSMGEV
jgi:hypothetical protein